MPTIEEMEVQKLLSQFTPAQQQLAKSVATMRIENTTMRNRLVALQAEYDELWKVLIVVLHACDDRELVIHESNLLRFKQEYRIDRWKEGEELHFKLKALTDDGKEEDDDKRGA